AIKHGLPIDYDKIAHMLRNAMGRFFSSILGTASYPVLHPGLLTKKEEKKIIDKYINGNTQEAIKILFYGKNKIKRKSEFVYKPPKRVQKQTTTRNGYKDIAMYMEHKMCCIICDSIIVKNDHVGVKRKRPFIDDDGDDDDGSPPMKKRKISNTQIEKKKIQQQSIICDQCIDKRSSYIDELLKRKRCVEEEMESLNIHCKVCLGEFYGTITCNAKDCSKYFKIQKIKYDIEDIHKQFELLISSTGKRNQYNDHHQFIIGRDNDLNEEITQTLL
ncbi:unnamed protein product, partial [marine sediment metagenome]